MTRVISFARGAPAPEALSADLVARCTQEALAEDGVRILSYGTGEGYPPLRELLAARHGVTADRVFITNGSLQGFVFLAETLLETGDTVAVEAPTYDRALLQLKLHGMQVMPIPMQADGLDVEALEGLCAGGAAPRMLYTIPTFQNPSGATMSLEKRKALVDVAERYDIVILEDDPYGELRFEGEPLPRLVDIGGPDRVLFTSSFSKTVAPGLRVGYIVVPADLRTKLAAIASRTYISPSLLAQAAIHRVCVGGHLEPNIRKVTELLRVRRDAMVAGLEHFPADTTCSRPNGGFFCWVELPEPLSADALFAEAEKAGVLYVKGSDCYLVGGERSLRLAYSGVSPEDIAEGMARLGTVFSGALAKVG
ncbi:MAG: PLP-dependent aminotransferase family protein [Actinomycetota bacterium]